MKKLLLMFLSAFSIISCVDIESADFEDEIYEPKELKVKSVFLKWIDDDYINMVSTKTDYYYGANGYVSEIESYEIQKEAEERTTKNFYYTGNLIDSIVTNYEYKLTTGYDVSVYILFGRLIFRIAFQIRIVLQIHACQSRQINPFIPHRNAFGFRKGIIVEGGEMLL